MLPCEQVIMSPWQPAGLQHRSEDWTFFFPPPFFFSYLVLFLLLNLMKGSQWEDSGCFGKQLFISTWKLLYKQQGQHATGFTFKADLRRALNQDPGVFCSLIRTETITHLGTFQTPLHTPLCCPQWGPRRSAADWVTPGQPFAAAVSLFCFWRYQ